MANTELVLEKMSISKPLSRPHGYPDAAKEASRSIKIGLWIIALMFGGLGSWMAFAPLHGAVVTAGQVKVESSRKTIQHLEGGIVNEILVKEGDEVKQGQTLVTLKNVSADTQLQMYRDQLAAEQANAARLMAEEIGSGMIRFPVDLLERKTDPKVAEVVANETSLFNAKRATLNNEIALLNRQISEVKGEIAALENQIAATDKTKGYLTDELTVNEKLAEKGFVSNPRLLEFKRNISTQDDRRSEYSADIARARQKVNELNLRIANLKHEYTTRASDELKASQEKIVDIQQRLKVPEDTIARQNITSPVAGKVVGLRVHTLGGVIAAREPLMDIVPDGGDMIIETRVQPNDIDDVRVDMPADVRLTAYKQRTTPLVHGAVIYIAADSLVDDATKQPYYLAHVRVEAKSLQDAGSDIHLYPGMPAEVYIQTQSRTALQYLLDPITATIRRSFRES